MKNSKNITKFVGLLISAVFIVLLIRNINFSELGRHLSKASYHIVLIGILFHFSGFYIRSLRWKLIIARLKATSTGKLFPIVCISYAANNLLPLRAGEFVRAYLGGKKESISKTAVFSTVVVERIIDGITLLCFLLIVSFIYPFPSWVNNIALITAIIFAGAVAFVVMAVALKDKMVWLFNKVLFFIPIKIKSRLSAMLEKLIEGFNIIQSIRQLIGIMVLSFAIWAVESSIYYFTLAAFGVENALAIAVFTMVIVNIGIMIPSSPGYVGTFEFFFVQSLSVFQVANELAIGIALVTHFAQHIPITAAGIVFMLKEGLTLGSINKLDKREA